MGEDLAIDIPKVWTHIAAVVVPLLIGEALTLKDLSSSTNVLKGTPVAAVLLNSIIQGLIKEKGPSWIRDHMEAEKVSWTDFLEANDAEEFVKKINLDSFTGGALASSREAVGSGSGMTQAEIQDKLLELLRPAGGKTPIKYEDIQEWISANVGQKNASELSFIRALMTAICKSVINEQRPGKFVVDTEKLLAHSKLLLHYVDSNEERELQCLYAVVALVNHLSHPQGLVQTLFSALWENTTISSEAFQAWFKSKDPREQAGKSVCQMSLISFETLLKETDECDEDES